MTVNERRKYLSIVLAGMLLVAAACDRAADASDREPANVAGYQEAADPALPLVRNPLKPAPPATCPVAPPQRLREDLGPMAGGHPVWLVTDGSEPWSEAGLRAMLWVVAKERAGGLTLTARRLDGVGQAQFSKWTSSGQTPLTASLTIRNAHAGRLYRSVEGDASTAARYADHEVLVGLPAPGCWEFSATQGSERVRVVVWVYPTLLPPHAFEVSRDALDNCPVADAVKLVPEIADVVGQEPVWFTPGGAVVPWVPDWSVGKRLWVVAKGTPGDLVVTGRRLDGPGVMLFQQHAFASLAESFVIRDAGQGSATPGGAGRSTVQRYAFHPSYDGTVVPEPGCWETVARVGDAEVRIVQRYAQR